MRTLVTRRNPPGAVAMTTGVEKRPDGGRRGGRRGFEGGSEGGDGMAWEEAVESGRTLRNGWRGRAVRAATAPHG